VWLCATWRRRTGNGAPRCGRTTARDDEPPSLLFLCPNRHQACDASSAQLAPPYVLSIEDEDPCDLATTTTTLAIKRLKNKQLPLDVYLASSPCGTFPACRELEPCKLPCSGTSSGSSSGRDRVGLVSSNHHLAAVCQKAAVQLLATVPGMVLPSRRAVAGETTYDLRHPGPELGSAVGRPFLFGRSTAPVLSYSKNFRTKTSNIKEARRPTKRQ
jgi:hypothetical protein